MLDERVPKPGIMKLSAFWITGYAAREVDKGG